jgi:GxxExxY protein
MDSANDELLIKRIIQCIYNVRGVLSPGFLEKVYKNALYIELKDQGIPVETEVPVNVFYKNHVVGSYKADMIVNKNIIIELKATQHLSLENEVQLVNYLTALNIENGILVNFGSDKIEIKRKYKTYRKL